MQALIEPPDELPLERTARGDATLVKEPPGATAAAATPNLRAPKLYSLTTECTQGTEKANRGTGRREFLKRIVPSRRAWCL